QSGCECGCETRPLHKLSSEALLVVLEHLLPAGLSHNHTLTNLLRVRQEFGIANSWHRKLMRAAKGGRTNRITERSLIHSLDQITRLLKFNRKEVSCRDVHSLQVNARLISSARSYLI